LAYWPPDINLPRGDKGDDWGMGEKNLKLQTSKEYGDL